MSQATNINNCVVYNLMIVCNKVIITIYTQKLFGFSKNRDTSFRFRTNENFEYMSMVCFYVEHTIIVGFRTLDFCRWDSYSQILDIPRWSETVTGNICEILAFWKILYNLQYTLKIKLDYWDSKRSNRSHPLPPSDCYSSGWI